MMSKMILYHSERLRELGGPGSGNFGHSGRPGERGGSGEGWGGGGDASVHASGPGSEKGHWDMKMSDDEQIALKKYSGIEYKNINRGLYDPPPPESVDNYIKDLDSVIDRSTLESDVTVYSGLGTSASAMLSDLDEGSEVDFSGYLSTSTKEGIAGVFSKGGDTGSRMMLVLNLHRGSRGFYMGDSDMEKELLLPRGQRYKINKIVNDKKFIKYHVSVA